MRIPYPLCNNRPATAAQLFGVPLLLCCRCCGVVIGASICAATSAITPLSPFMLSLAVLGLLACGIDGYLSYFSNAGSTNSRRFTTGMLGGWGASVLALPLAA